MAHRLKLNDVRPWVFSPQARSWSYIARIATFLTIHHTVVGPGRDDNLRMEQQDLMRALSEPLGEIPHSTKGRRVTARTPNSAWRFRLERQCQFRAYFVQEDLA